MKSAPLISPPLRYEIESERIFWRLWQGMKSLVPLIFCALLAAAPAHAASKPKPTPQPTAAAGSAKKFPLLGAWVQIGYIDAAGKSHKTEMAQQMYFRPDGTLVEAAQDMTLDGNTYTYRAPDLYIINWNFVSSRHTQRMKFRLDGQILSVVAGDLDSDQDPAKESKIIMKWRRVKG